MKFWNTFVDATKALIARNFSTAAQGFLRGDDTGSNGGATMTTPYAQSSWVYAAISTIASGVAQIPFRISEGQRKGEKIVESGAIVDFFNHPHSTMDRYLFWEMILTWLCLRGEFFIVPLNKQGQSISKRKNVFREAPASMLVLSPDQFFHIIEGYELAGWRFTGMPLQSPIESQLFLPEEIIHTRLANPYFYWRGLSPLTVAQVPAQTDFASSKFMQGLMMNNADTGVIITTDQQLSVEQQAQISAALRERKRVAGTADRPLLLWGGAKLEKPTISSADMQFLENRKLNRLEICAIFHVPQTLVGFTEDANRAIAQEERLSFVENALAGHCDRLEAAVDCIVKAFDLNYFGWFDLDSLPIMQLARRNRIDSAGKAFAMGWPINEINKVYDLGFPDVPWGNTGYLPAMLQEVGTGEAAKVEDVDTDDPNEAGADPISRAVRFFDRMTGLGVDKGAGASTPHVCMPDAAYQASIAGSIKIKKGRISKLFFEQRGRVLGKLPEIHKGLSHTIDLRSSAGIMAMQKAMDDLWDKSGENDAIKKKLFPLLQDDLAFGAAQIGAEIGVADIAVTPQDAMDYLQARVPALQDINETTWGAVRQSLSDGLGAGETMEQLADRVKTVFTDATNARADRIALTETTAAVNGGRQNAMTTAKVPLKGWQSSNLENTRPAHAAASVQYKDGIPVDEAFIVDGEELMYPGDPSGSPGNVINCRCFTFALLGKSGGQALTQRLSFETWRDRK